MASKNFKTELLAPAQNLSTAKCAITYGADAVYIGANAFGARKNASNNLSDIEEAVKFAHKFGAKIFVTVNTILDDNELKEAQKLIYNLYNIGVDAIIFQDMGLLELDLPPIELHASTQCDNRTIEKVQFLEKIGIKRAILARELSIDNIRAIKKETCIELECFIHGALCVSYSGQCYMSANIGGRSANRGECAQACRMKYNLVDESGKEICKNKYLLSLKDFCAEKYLDELVKIGVKSFKIEGRLKDENYVKNCVLYYRRLLDKYEKTSDGFIVSDFEPDINKVFNRKYTTYFLSGKSDNISNIETPKSMGEYLGKVQNVSKDGFEIKTEKEISQGDGLCFISEEGLIGSYVNKVLGKKIITNNKLKINNGDKIYRNFDIKFENVLKNSRTKRLIDAFITVYNNEISISDKKNSFSIPYEFLEFAQNEEKMRENFIKSFEKSGDSIFSVKNIEFKLDRMPFLPVSKINEIRRELFFGLEEIRVKNYKKEAAKKIKPFEFKPLNSDYRLNVRNFSAQEFYRKCGVNVSEFAPEKTGEFKAKEIMRTKHCIRRLLGICLKEVFENKKLYLIHENGMKFPLEFDCKNCEMIIRGV